MLRPDTRLRDYHVNVCSNFGGLGDMIARLPAFKYAVETYENVVMNVYWHDYVLPLVERLLPSTERMRHKKLSDMAFADSKLPLLDFSPTHISSFSMHMTEHAFLMLLNRIPRESKDMWYLQDDRNNSWHTRSTLGLDGKPFVVLTTGFTAPVREWLPKEVNKVKSWCERKGYVPVLLGSSQPMDVGNGNVIKSGFRMSELDMTGVNNLIDQTSITQALDVMRGAQAVVGVDNGLLHLASCTTTPVVWGFTSLVPEHRLPYLPGTHRHEVVIPKKLSCAGCQSKVYFARHEFKYCMYGDNACVTMMKGELFIEALERLGL